MNNYEIKEKLINLSEDKYKLFTQNLLPGINNILGVRIPILRSLAKEIASNDYNTYLKNADTYYFEEIMLQGLVISSLKKIDINEHLEYIDCFVPKINSWSVCDSFCSGLKITKTNQSKVLDLINKYINSKNEYEVRFSIIMLMNYYIDDEHIDFVLESLNNIKSNFYYVNMGIAWAISMCYVKYKEKTLHFLNNNTLDDFTYNKSLQKIRESNRVSKEEKDFIKTLKRI